MVSPAAMRERGASPPPHIAVLRWATFGAKRITTLPYSHSPRLRREKQLLRLAAPEPLPSVVPPPSRPCPRDRGTAPSASTIWCWCSSLIVWRRSTASCGTTALSRPSPLQPRLSPRPPPSSSPQRSLGWRPCRCSPPPRRHEVGPRNATAAGSWRQQASPPVSPRQAEVLGIDRREHGRRRRRRRRGKETAAAEALGATPRSSRCAPGREGRLRRREETQAHLVGTLPPDLEEHASRAAAA